MSQILDIEQLIEQSKSITHHAIQLTEFAETLRKIEYSIESWERNNYRELFMEIRKLRDEQESLRLQLAATGAIVPSTGEKHFQDLCNLISSDTWPLAVPEDLIPRTDDQQQRRSEIILNLHVIEDLTGVRFLDVGCGFGWTANAAAHRGAIAVGYDIHDDWRVQLHDQCSLTTSRQQVIDHGPYDVILMYDVLDHVENDVIELLRFVKSVLAPQGRVYVRAHPWCSRHGGDLYEKLNKAFVHVMLNEKELTKVFQVNAPYVNKLTNPRSAYKNWFASAGFHVTMETPVYNNLESFFAKTDNYLIYDKFKALWPGHDMNINLSLEYVDYQLTNTDLNDYIFE